MKKIGIITIPDYNNYGNRLQNFAVKTFFSEMGYKVDTLELNDTEFPQYQARKIKLLLKKFKLRPLIYLAQFANGKTEKVKRYKKFERFTEKHLNVKHHPNGRFRALQKIAGEYDYIVLGSDQIWHPTVNTTPNLFFASFVDPKKVLFFSPSFGVEKLPDEYAKRVKQGLSNKENLTVREISGQKIIRELLGKDAKVLPDPTLCIRADIWKELAEPLTYTKGEPYVLEYFLGSESKDYKEEIERICREYGANPFVLAKEGNKSGYATGPREFLGGILNAESVVTDSFHAVVFCIMFQKPFTVFSRLNEKGENEGLDSRIDVLLENFGIETCKYCSHNKGKKEKIDSSKFQGVLDSMRNKATEHFKNTIE